ncbi:hypothetical protein H0H92_005950 [Tricholoma furcatifolium]|nr:hypothetical protein H0H92_005950 [Tricholoma furcatifolium]
MISADIRPQSDIDVGGDTEISISSKGTVVDSVPSEILADIFNLIIDGSFVVFPPDFSAPHWVLTRVCRRWRNVAFSDPCIWHRFSLGCANAYTPTKIIRFALEMLRPNGLLALQVRDTRASPFPVEKAIVPFLPHLKALEADISTPGHPVIFQQSGQSFINMESLSLEFWFDSIDESLIEAATASTIFDSALSLRELKFWSFLTPEGTRLAGAILRLPIPWHQLHALTFTLCPLDQQMLQFLLHRCTSLKHFAFITNVSTLDEDLTLPTLTSLSLGRPVPSPSRPHLFQHLTLPKLTTLQISNIYHEGVFLELSEVIARSKCSLAILKLEGQITEEPTALKSFMSLIVTIREFRLHGLLLSASTLKRIGGGALIPHAHALRCDIDDPLAFVDALEMRLTLDKQSNGGVSSFREAYAECSRWVCSETAMETAREKMKGLGSFAYTLHWKTERRRSL